MIRSRAQLTLLAALMGVAAVIAYASSQGGSQRRESHIDGPITGLGPGGFSRNENVGTRFTDGQLVLRNNSGKELKLVEVKPVISGDGLTFLGAQVAGHDREIGITQYIPRFPPRRKELGRVTQVRGAVLPPEPNDPSMGYEVLLGYEVTGPRRSTVPAVRVTYSDGDRTWTEEVIATVAVCTPAAREEDCPMEYGKAGSP